MPKDKKNNIPAVELMHNTQPVNFAFRTMQEIHEKFGNTPDIPHRHNYYTILWSSNACGQHFIDYKEHIIRPNVIFFVNPGQVHQVITFGNPEGVIIMFTKEFLTKHQISENFLTNLGLFSGCSETPPLEINESNSGKLKDLASAIEVTFREDSEYKTDQLAAYLKLFLIECNKLAPKLESENPQVIQSSLVILRKFNLLVNEHFSKWHKVALYAEKLNISPDYLNNVVKTAVGKTAKEFIQDRIVLEAKRIGVYTELSNKEIAFQIGFEDPAHFSKFYKNIEGISFSTFRKSISNSTAL